jgi:hypothetical protein
MDVKEIRLKLNLTHNLSYFIKEGLIMERITMTKILPSWTNSYMAWKSFYFELAVALNKGLKINKIYQTKTVYTVYLR